MDILATIYRIKEFAFTGINNFPLIVAMTSIVLVCSTANMGFSVLFVCLALIVPVLVWLLNIVSPYLLMPLNYMLAKFGRNIPIIQSTADTCKMGPSPGIVSLYPSYWMASVLFIFSFTFWNGLQLYLYESSPDTPSDKVEARKASAVIGMVASLALLLLFLIVRLMSGCETGFGVFMAIGFIGLGIGMFELFRGCGLLRLVDLFGIGGRLLPMSATANPTQVCFPVAGADKPATPTTPTTTN